MGANRVVGAVLAAWAVAGCGSSGMEEEPSLSLGSTVAEIVVANGTQLNGPILNGINPNGTALSQTLVSVRYEGARRAGMSTPLEAVWLEGSQLYGLLAGQELSGGDLTQVQFVGNLGNGGTLPLRIEGVSQGAGADSDVWTYRVSYQEPMTGQWQPLCKAADGTALNAIPLEGHWDYREGVAGGGAKVQDSTTFTFACEGAALAKCVRFGYAPWRSVDGVSLADHHQACTRLVRADLCGNGTPYTVNGNWVNLYDQMSVQVDTESWNAEAEWDADGARCFTSNTRATEPVQCGDRLVPTCGGSFSAGTLLISETPPSTTQP